MNNKKHTGILRHWKLKELESKWQKYHDDLRIMTLLSFFCCCFAYKKPLTIKMHHTLLKHLL